MAKQKTASDELFFTFGMSMENDNLYNTYIEEIVNDKLREYQEIIQWGAKEGQSLYLHILNGVCVLERLRPILDLNDIELQVLFSAYSVHDLNKLKQFQDQKRSFNYLANSNNVSAALSHLDIGRFFPDWEDYIKDIELLIRAHSRYHHSYDETLDLNYDPYTLNKDRLLNYLIPIIRGMDVIDLSKSLEEQAKKQDFLKEINSICDIQYEFVYHKVSEQRGVFTNLIHNEIASYMEEEKDLLPLLYYPNGIAYLIDKNRKVEITHDEITHIGTTIVEALESKTVGKFSKFIQNSPAGIKIDEKCLLLGISFEEIWNEVRNIISEKSYAANVDVMNDRALGRLQEEGKKLLNSKPTKKNPDPAAQAALINELLTQKFFVLPPDDMAIRIGELVRTYYIFLNKHFSKQITDAWIHIYDLLKLPLDIEEGNLRSRYTAFSALYDRGYIIGRDLYNSGMTIEDVYQLIVDDGTKLMDTLQTESEFKVLREYVHKYIDFDFAVDRDKNFATNLTRYVKDNHVQCSTCGSEFDTDLWMKPDVPQNMKVQQFSNRLEGGSSREPKRRVCSVCRTQYMIDKMCYNVTSSTSTFYIHLYPPSFFTDGLIKAFREAYNRFRDPEFPSVYINTYNTFRRYREMAQLELQVSKTKSNGNPIPEFSEAIGNILTVPVNTPGQNNHTEQMLYAIQNALLYQRFLGCRAVLTDSSIPIFSGNEFSNLFIDHIPTAFRGWLPDNDLDSETTNQVFHQLINLHNIQVKIGSIETDDLIRLIRSLNYDTLELYYITHKMIKREQSGNEPLQFTTIRDTAKLIANVVVQKGGDEIMSHIKELARIAWDGRLKGESLKDNSLAKPLDVAFDSFERWQPEIETEEEARAIMTKEVAKAIERLNPKFFGASKMENISQFVKILFEHIYKEVYQNNLLSMLENRKRIRSGYLYFITEMIPKSDKNKEEQQS
ncbi:type I-D CRISPR-associated protein Cas10d/Csc3 [Candidatus Poribacteria bacterium]|nr:type I-D CRISPR-associated protein Cas10d/Csc3 [Candidatus Poribacteria bacterium]